MGCMAGCFTLGSVIPLAEPSGLSLQTPAICKWQLLTVLLPQKPAPETPLPCSPSPGPALVQWRGCKTTLLATFPTAAGRSRNLEGYQGWLWLTSPL